MREEEARLQKSAKTVWGSGSGCSKSGQRYANLCPLDSATGLSNTYPLDGDLSRRMAVDTAIHLLNKLGLELSKLGSGNV